MNNFRIEMRDGGVGILVIDVPESRMNALGGEVQAELAEAVEAIATDPAIRSIVVASAKADAFSAGGDLVRLYGLARAGESLPLADRDAMLDSLHVLNGAMRRLESCGKPVAAAIDGLALGGGLELAMSTHRRFVADRDEIRLGLPEIKVGLIPGAGGTQRLPRLIGVEPALELMLEGRLVSPNEALALGLIDEVVSADSLVATAVTWAAQATDPVQRWDRPDFRITGSMTVEATRAQMNRRWMGDFRAAEVLIDAVREGIALPIDLAISGEEMRFMEALLSPQAAPIMRTCFFSPRELRRAGHQAALDETYLNRLRTAHDDEVTPPQDEGASDATQRLLYRQAIEAARCLEDRAVESPSAGDVAAITELGFPLWTGGPFSWIDGMGAAAFVDRCEELAGRYGPRFTPPASVVRLAAEGGAFYAS